MPKHNKKRKRGGAPKLPYSNDATAKSKKEGQGRKPPSTKPSHAAEQQDGFRKHRLIELPVGKKFLSSEDGESYQLALDTIYNGFAFLPADEIPRSFHSRSRAALEALQDAGYYQYDIVMAGGKKLSRTFVQRTLVGEPGLTYKYLGLR